WLVTLPKIWLAVFYLGVTYFFMWLFVFVWYIFHHLFHLLVPSLIDWWRRRRAGYLCLIV
ncbi:hypothetical protein KJ665_02535, partial [Patescibacteria group bacterium]|nr:hypothetical protein [Patescibacteria group bacterium]